MNRRKALYTIASAFGFTASMGIFKMDVDRPDRIDSGSDPGYYPGGEPDYVLDRERGLEDYNIGQSSESFNYGACEVEESQWIDEFDL